ncbi:GtrA family protein [Actinosynnema sp. NPDC053489]|uniref:GtrA family protein n=1 Tax=Actinosynnema sp. NPDC053489 TaxID=3363916 RepID=UPI0037C5641F
MRPGTGTSLRFGAVGVVNTLVDVVGYTGLVLAGTPAFAANLVSTSAGMAVSFVLNRSFTFRAGSGALRVQVPLFVLCTAPGPWLVQPLVIATTGDLVTGPTTLTAVTVPKLAGLALALVCNYVLYRKVVFRPRPRTGSRSPAPARRSS